MSEKCSKVPTDLKTALSLCSCKAIDKDKARLDRISLSDVSFSVANKPKRKINRGREKNKIKPPELFRPWHSLWRRIKRVGGPSLPPGKAILSGLHQVVPALPSSLQSGVAL